MEKLLIPNPSGPFRADKANFSCLHNDEGMNKFTCFGLTEMNRDATIFGRANPRGKECVARSNDNINMFQVVLLVVSERGISRS